MSQNDERELKNPRISTLIISDTESSNPYGPNYILLPYETKLYYKWLRLKKYIHLSEVDQERHINQNYIFYGSLIATGLTMYSLAYLTKNYMLVKSFPKTYDLFNEMPAIYYGLWISAGVSKTFTAVNTYHINDYVIPNLEKYIDEAKENGFANYEISQTVGSMGIIDRLKIAYG